MRQLPDLAPVETLATLDWSPQFLCEAMKPENIDRHPDPGHPTLAAYVVRLRAARCCGFADSPWVGGSRPALVPHVRRGQLSEAVLLRLLRRSEPAVDDVERHRGSVMSALVREFDVDEPVPFTLTEAGWNATDHLPAGPLLRQIELHGGLAAVGVREHSAEERALSRAARDGWLTYAAADRLAVTLLGLTPWKIWPDLD